MEQKKMWGENPACVCTGINTDRTGQDGAEQNRVEQKENLGGWHVLALGSACGAAFCPFVFLATPAAPPFFIFLLLYYLKQRQPHCGTDEVPVCDGSRRLGRMGGAGGGGGGHPRGSMPVTPVQGAGRCAGGSPRHTRTAPRARRAHFAHGGVAAAGAAAGPGRHGGGRGLDTGESLDSDENRHHWTRTGRGRGGLSSIGSDVTWRGGAPIPAGNASLTESVCWFGCPRALAYRLQAA
eukprot:gene10430-biopygen19809